MGILYSVGQDFAAGELTQCPADSTNKESLNLGSATNPWPPEPASGVETRADYSVRPAKSFWPRSQPSFSRLDDFAEKAVASDYISSLSTYRDMHGDGGNAVYGDGHISWVPAGHVLPFLANISGWGSANDTHIDQVFDMLDQSN